MVDRPDDPYNLATLNSDQLMAPSAKISTAEDNADMMTAPDSDYEEEEDAVMQGKHDEQEDKKEPLDDVKFNQLTEQALQQPSTIVDAQQHSHHAEASSIDSDKVVPVVSVQVLTNSDGIINVTLHVTSRYVPHLHTNATANLLQSVLQRNNMQAVDDDGTSIDTEEDGDNNAADLTGNDFEMTDDLETDRKRLLQLIGGTMSESDSSDDSRSSDDDDDSEKPSLEHHLAEEEEESYGSNAYIRSKNEIVEPTAVDVEPIIIPAEAEVLLAGQLITPNVDGYSIVQGIRGQRPLGLNSVLCHADRSPLGRIEEVIGNVSEPFYTVRASKQQQGCSHPPADDDNDDEAFLARLNGTNLNNSATPSTPIYYVPSLSQFAQADQTPGSDASNLYDEEVADHEREYSDDEDEAAAKAARKSSKKRGVDGKPAVITDALPQQQQYPHQPQSHNPSARHHQPHHQQMPQPTTYAPNYQLNSYHPMQPQPQPHHYAPQQGYQHPYHQYQHPPPQYPPAMHQQAPMQQHQPPHQPAPSGYQPVSAQPTYQQSTVPNPYHQQSSQNPYYAPQSNNPYYTQQQQQQQPQNTYMAQQHTNNPYYQQQSQQHPMPSATNSNAQQPPGL